MDDHVSVPQMSSDSPGLAADGQLAAQLAAETMERLVALRVRLVDEGKSARYIMDEGDRRAHEFLVKRLAETRPDDAVLSEEDTQPHHAKTRLAAERLWIIDPLDGTHQYGENPRTDWAVHVGLVIDHQPVAGAVALHPPNPTMTTANPLTLVPEANNPLRMVLTRNYFVQTGKRAAETMGAELVEMGSAGVKAMAVVRGECDLYVHSGGQFEWDSCAPVAVAQKAGCHVSKLDGSPLLYNQPDLFVSNFLICRPELADQALAALAPHI